MDLATRTCAAWYRAAGGNVPSLVLKRLGVATSERRPSFYAIERLLKTIPDKGIIVEAGVYKGATLLGIAHRVRGKNKTIVGLDSFLGLNDWSPYDGTPRPGDLSDSSYDEVRARLDALGFWDVRLLDGQFQDTLPFLQGAPIAFAHIDCDLYWPTRQCIEFLLPRMIPGGVMLFDDYGSHKYRGATRAVMECDFFLESVFPDDLGYFNGERWYMRVKDERGIGAAHQTKDAAPSASA